MKRKKLKLFIIIILVVIECGSLFLSYKSYMTKPRENKDSILLDNSSVFALMINDGNGNYIESTSSKWPSGDYVYNAEKSGCVNINGDELENVLTFDSENNIAYLNTNTSAYCYLYFDIGDSIEDCVGTLGECLMKYPTEGLNSEQEEGGLYRYQGGYGAVDNFICFGTSDKNTCLSNTDAYMYRVMGINADNQVKLLRNNELNDTPYSWYTADDTTNITWPNSDIYKGLNGLSGGAYSNLFVNSSVYTYMATNSEWYNKIADYNWKYGVHNKNENISAEEMYAIENGWTTTTTAKIGLQYLHDYYYGLPGGNNCSKSGGNYTTCKTSWLYTANNEDIIPYPHEELMMSYLFYNGTYWGYSVYSFGYVTGYRQSDEQTIRPTFYLLSEVQYLRGTGTYEDPFLIK